VRVKSFFLGPERAGTRAHLGKKIVPLQNGGNGRKCYPTKDNKGGGISGAARSCLIFPEDYCTGRPPYAGGGTLAFDQGERNHTFARKVRLRRSEGMTPWFYMEGNARKGGVRGGKKKVVFGSLRRKKKCRPLLERSPIFLAGGRRGIFALAPGRKNLPKGDPAFDLVPFPAEKGKNI